MSVVSCVLLSVCVFVDRCALFVVCLGCCCPFVVCNVLFVVRG